MSVRRVRGRPGFIDEDELGGIKVQLIVEPALALLQEIGAALLYRVASLFYVSGHAGPRTGAVPTC